MEKIHQEDITRTQTDRHKLNKNSTQSSSINNISLDMYNFTVDDVRIMEHDIAYEINVVRHRYSNDQSFKGKPIFPKFCKNCSRSGHSVSTCPDKRYTKHLENANFQKKTIIQAMRGNQNLPNKQVTLNNMTGKPLPFSYRSSSNSRKNLDTEVRINRPIQIPNSSLWDQ